MSKYLVIKNSVIGHYLVISAIRVIRNFYPCATHDTITYLYRNFDLLSIGYAFRPHLRCRLTPNGRTLLGKPWTFGGKDSHPAFATHTGILTSSRSTQLSN